MTNPTASHPKAMYRLAPWNTTITIQTENVPRAPTIAVSGSDVVPQRTFSGGRHGRSRPGSLTRRTTTDRWAAVNEIIDPKM